MSNLSTPGDAPDDEQVWAAIGENFNPDDVQQRREVLALLSTQDDLLASTLEQFPAVVTGIILRELVEVSLKQHELEQTLADLQGGAQLLSALDAGLMGFGLAVPDDDDNADHDTLRAIFHARGTAIRQGVGLAPVGPPAS